MHSKSLKKILIILLCISMLSTFSGCISNLSSIDKEFKDKSESMHLDGSTITIMASKDWIKEPEYELGTNFEAATGIQVIYELYPDNEYLDELLKRLNNSDTPDIFLSQSGYAIKNTYNLDKYSVDLSNEPWVDSYSTYAREETSIDGKLYGMTYYDTTTDYYLVYNKKILANAGVEDLPTTFKSFEDMCEKILKTGVIPIYEPMADGWHQTMLFAEIGQVFEKLDPTVYTNLNANITSFSQNGNMRKAMYQIYNLSHKGYFGTNYKTDTYENAVGYLASGEYAMCMLKPGSINEIIDSDLNKGYKAEDFGIMLLPICDNQTLNIHSTGPSRFISSSSKNIDAAKLYLEYIATKENVQFMIDNSNEIENLPFNVGQTPLYTTTTEQFLSQFDDASSGMVVQDEVTYFNEQWNNIADDILKMCSGELTAVEVLEEIDRRRAEFAKAANDPNWK